MIRTETSKSVIYKYDGFNQSTRCFEQGAFTGKYIVPKSTAKSLESEMPPQYADFRVMIERLREGGGYKIRLINPGRIR